MTTASWMTKYGKRRVRHEPPTLEEALSAAEGICDEPAQQIALAAELMQLPVEQVKADAERILKSRTGRSQIQIVSGRRTVGTVVVERKPARRVLTSMPARAGGQRVLS